MPGPGIHVFGVRGRWFAVDAVNGALFAVGADAASILADWDRLGPEQAAGRLSRSHGPERARSFVDRVRELIDSGALFAPEPPLAGVRERARALRGLRALCLNVAHACNMACQYCFAARGSYGQERSLMSPHVARKAVEFLFSRAAPGVRLEIDFFGGEPLLNLPAVQAAVDRARGLSSLAGQEVRFTLTTNAIALCGDVAEYVNETMDNVVLSIDGREHVHDRWRRMADGSGSHHRVLANCQQFVSRRRDRDYWVRGTYTRHNLDFAADVQYLADRGFSRLSLEPVVCAPTAEFFLGPAQRRAAAVEYGKVADILLAAHAAKKDVRFFHFQLAAEDRTCRDRRAQGCGAGIDYVAVTPTGDIYPCHQFVEFPQFRQGNVTVDTWTIPEWASEADLFGKRDCPDCWARYMCGGGCHAAAYLAGDIMRPEPGACELHRERLQWALYLAAELKSRQQL